MQLVLFVHRSFFSLNSCGTYLSIKSIKKIYIHIWKKKINNRRGTSTQRILISLDWFVCFEIFIYASLIIIFFFSFFSNKDLLIQLINQRLVILNNAIVINKFNNFSKNGRTNFLLGHLPSPPHPRLGKHI